MSATPLPRQLTPFVGRERELAELDHLLRDPHCRLLTLVGVGGTGKTRLALAAAERHARHFAQGVVFVPCQDADTRTAFLTTLAAALDCKLAGAQDPLTQLRHFLADQAFLLVLDNLEQLLDEIAVLSDLLDGLAGIKVLATARELLNLDGEWVYPVAGLPSPAGAEAADPDELASYDAVRLFVEHARRARPGFALAPVAAEVATICHLVEGMPLALELAAAWLKTLTCADVAAEIQRSVDFLSTNRRDIAPRHRSIRAVCDQSWRQLSPQDRMVYAQLALFRGGFQRRAAEQVCGATLELLNRLVEKSLVRWEPDTQRYRLHELLRQYARAHLAQDPGVETAAQSRHLEFYVDFLATQGEAILEGEQLRAMLAIAPEMDNIRAAWEWAIHRADAARLAGAARTLVDFFQTRSRYQEGVQMLVAAVAAVAATPATPAGDAALAQLRTGLGSLLIRLGRIAEAQTVLQAAQAFYQARQQPLPPGYNTDPAFSLGIIALIQGEPRTAARLGERVLQTSTRDNHPHNRQLAHFLLANAALAQGELAEAHDHAQTACDLARATASHWFMAYCLNELGALAFALGDYTGAQRHYAESLAIRRTFDDPEGMAVALVRLGEIALVLGDAATAWDLCAQSEALYRRIGDQGGLAAALAGLAHAALGLARWDSARALLREALALAAAIQYLPCLLSILHGAGLLLIATQAPTEGVALLAYVARHPHTPRHLVDQIQRRLGAELAYLAPQYLAAQQASSVDAETELPQVIRRLEAMLTGGPASLRAAAASQPTAVTVPSLPEPLSARELELLRLLAAGLKNREIADQLIISVNTVKVHINNIYGKLGVTGRVQAVARARELALL